MCFRATLPHQKIAPLRFACKPLQTYAKKMSNRKCFAVLSELLRSWFVGALLSQGSPLDAESWKMQAFSLVFVAKLMKTKCFPLLLTPSWNSLWIQL